MKKHKNLVFAHFKNSSDINHEIFSRPRFNFSYSIQSVQTDAPSPPTGASTEIAIKVLDFMLRLSPPALTIHRPEGKYFVQEKCAPSCDERNKRFFSYVQASERAENFQLFHRSYFKMYICLESDRLWNSCTNLLLGARAVERRQWIYSLFPDRSCIIRSVEQSNSRRQLMMHQTHTAGKIASLNLGRK